MRLLPNYSHLANTPDHELTTGQIAKATGVPYSTVISYVTRTMVRLPAKKVANPRGAYYVVTVRDLLAFEPPSLGRPCFENGAEVASAATDRKPAKGKTSVKAAGKVARKKTAKARSGNRRKG